MNSPLARAQRGFNLVEIMVVLGIMAVLAAIAAPNMGAMIRTQRLKTASFDVFSSLAYARSEAIKRNTLVTVQPTNAANWVYGWAITDSNGNVLRNQTGWHAAAETSPTFSITGPALVRFNSAGRSTAAGDIALTSSYVDVTKHRCVSVELSGRAVTKEGAC